MPFDTQCIERVWLEDFKAAGAVTFASGRDGSEPSEGDRYAVRPSSPANYSWYRHRDRNCSITVQAPGRKKGRAVGCARDRIVSIDIAKPYKSPDIVLLFTRLPSSPRSDSRFY